MITYNEIDEARRKEMLYPKQLQPVPDNFIEEVREYLKDKKELSLKEIDDFSDVVTKTKKQLENAITVFNEFLRLRKRKILDLVLISSETGSSKHDLDNMMDFEKELFNEILHNVESYDKKVSDALNRKNEMNSNMNLKIREDLDEFMGLDGNMLGPFKKGDEVELPKDIANILLESGKAMKA